MKTNKMIKWAACGASLMMMVTVSALADNYYWGVANGDWDGASWSGAQAGGSPSAKITTNADSIYFFTDDISSATATLAGSKALNNLFLNKAGYRLTGGTLDFTGAADGILQVNASGTINSALNNFKSIQFNTADKTLTLTGGWNDTSTATLDTFVNGSAGQTSTLILSEGTYVSSGNSGIRTGFRIGNASAETGGVILKEGAVFNNTGNKFTILNNGGLFQMQGGQMNFTGNGGYASMIIGYGGNSVGKFIMTGGTLTQGAGATSGIFMGLDNGQGTFDMKGGKIDIRNFVIGNGFNNAAAYGILNISGGETNVQGISFGGDFVGSGWMGGVTASTGTGILNMSGGQLNIGARGMIAKNADSFQTQINLSGGVIGVQNGASGWDSALNMTLSKGAGNSSVTFKTSDSANVGKEIALNGVLSGNGGLIKAGNGTLFLSGSNVYTGLTVINEGKLQVDGGGQLTISLADLGSDTAISGAGQLQLGGAAGSGKLNILTGGASGDSWQIIDTNLIPNTTYFSNFGVQTNGVAWTNNSGVWTWNDFTFTQSTGLLTMIPEPSTYALLLMGAAGIAGLRLIRKRG